MPEIEARNQHGWIPLTENMVDELYSAYCDWIDNLTEIRLRMSALRKAVGAGWMPDEISQRNLDRLNSNDETAAAKQMDVARTVLLCAEWSAREFFPDRQAQIERDMSQLIAAERERHKPTPEELTQFDRRLDVLRSLWCQGWRPFGENHRASVAATELYNWCSSAGRPFAFGSWPAVQIDMWLSHYEDQVTPRQSLRQHLIEMLKSERAKHAV